ncbi:MAG TPA: type VI secretion system ATPase TssH, partial [Spirochaetota bacterium]|nr:type VI secretion system ATPase TssH [Spirochaetota bacterium]
HIKDIIKLQLKELAERLKEKEITLNFSNDLVDFIANVGYDQHFGARPIRRAIQTYIENNIAKEIIAGNIVEKSELELNIENEELKFKIL